MALSDEPAHFSFHRSLRVVAEPDVLVVGAGCAGTAAAIAAARSGASTLVVERAGYCGGYITNVVGPSLDGFVDLRSGLPIVGGVVLDLVRAAAFADVPLDDPERVAGTRFRFNTELGHNRAVADRHAIRFDLERFKLAADRLLTEAGARVLYHTTVADVVRDGPRVTGVVIANKAGLQVVRPRAVVDASGDADVVAFAGAPFDLDASAPQPMSLHFRIGRLPADAELRDACGAVLDEAHAAGRIGLYGGPWMGRVEDDDIYFNATRLSGNPVDPDDLTAAEMQGRRDVRTMFELFKERLPAFRDAYLVSTGPAVGVRESRRIRCDEPLRAAAIAAAEPRADVVCLGGWWLDRHPAASSGYHPHLLVRPYDIGYATLVPQELDNVWVAGRCHGAEQAALASSRVTVTCMAMGQAAGTAAALAARADATARDLDVPGLQRRLAEDGAVILERADAVREVGDAMGEVSIDASH